MSSSGPNTTNSASRNDHETQDLAKSQCQHSDFSAKGNEASKLKPKPAPIPVKGTHFKKGPPDLKALTNQIQSVSLRPSGPAQSQHSTKLSSSNEHKDESPKPLHPSLLVRSQADNLEARLSLIKSPTTPLLGSITPKRILVAYLATSIQPFVFIKPGFAKGGYAHCSVWLGLDDHKYYLRKLQARRDTTPEDISHHVSHPSVPALFTHVEHGSNPRTSKVVATGDPSFGFQCGALATAMQQQRESRAAFKYWTTMHELIDGENLFHIIERYKCKGRLIPKSAIFQCAATILEVIAHMRYPPNNDEPPLAHNDIWPRNILVTIGDVSESNKFYLIDFGVATREPQAVAMRKDLYTLSETLYCMMQRDDDRGVSTANPGARRQEHPYSLDLTVQIGRIRKAMSPKKPPPSRAWLLGLAETFKSKARTSVDASKARGEDYKISVASVVPNQPPLAFSGECARQELVRHLEMDNGCLPCQTAWVEEQNLKVVSVEEERIWPDPEREILQRVVGW